MDKQEYKATIEMIKAHAASGQYNEATELCDGINWRKVNNVNNLVEAADVYEAAGNDIAARDLLLIAHDRSPVGRTIIYKLAMLYLKMGDIDTARLYHQKFVEIAPKDSLKYILKYNILVAGHADEDAIIKVLEQLREADFMEEWGYELAYLYHKNGRIEECVDLCDDLILWFGEGPYVERALELKMIYTPLDKSQEDKYRHFQQKREGITEIQANEELQSGEIISHTVTIPSIEIKQEKFNTVNLQAEIKKNIDEIMKATEAGEVCENMDAIKSLVEEIPYLQVSAPEEEEIVVEEKTDKPSINDVFKDYLREEYDGQISLLIPDDEEKNDNKDEDTEGQMSIEEVLSEWEKTRHAAELALEDARKQELELVKAKALKEANYVLNRLEEAMPKLDAGMSANELLKEEYLSSANSVVTKVDLPKEKEAFAFPILDANGNVSGGIAVPVVKTETEKAKIISGPEETAAVKRGSNLLSTAAWNPPSLTNSLIEADPAVKKAEEEMKSATSLLAGVNDMLQKEIDRVEKGDTAVIPEIKIPEIYTDPNEDAQDSIDLSEIARIMGESMQQNKIEKIVDEVKKDISETKESTSDIETPETVEVEVSVEDSKQINEEVQENKELPAIEETKVEEELPTVEKVLEKEELPVIEEIKVEEELPTVEKVLEKEELPVIEEIKVEEELPTVEKIQEKEELPVIEEIKIEEAPRETLVDVEYDVPAISLTPDDRTTFSYFLQLKGMEGHICRVLSNSLAAVNNGAISKKGNILIVGEAGTGKTKLATSFVKTIQNHTEYLKGAVGKIDGEKLNEKDLSDLFSKISGGSLIVENASGMNRNTAANLSLAMSSDKNGTLIVFEDSDEGINKVLQMETSFVKLFSEKIKIPVFTIDELVEFGRAYAADHNCVLDELAVLELYSKIDLITRFDHPTTITEVAEIMEDAVENATRRGIFRRKVKTDKEGHYIIRDKHFEEE